MITHSKRGEIARVSRYDELPEGSIPISSDDVFIFQMDRLKSWKPQSEIWPLTKGSSICSAVTVLSCVLTNNHFRKHFSLKHYGRVSGYMVAVCMPTVLTFIIHSCLVTRKVLIADFPCPSCLLTRSSIYQGICGAIYPSIISPIMCLIQAKRYLTAPIEPAKRLGDTVKILARTAIPFKGFILLSILSNMAVGLYVTQREMDTFLNVFMKKVQNEELE